MMKQVARRYVRQTVSLTKKCLKLQMRNKTATMTQLLIGVLFLALLVLMDSAVRNMNKSNTFYQQDFDPPLQNYTIPTQVPGCVPGPTASCKDFVYAPNVQGLVDEVEMENIISELMLASSIPDTRVHKLDNASMVDDYILANPNTTRVAIIFEEISDTITYHLQLNLTKTCLYIGVYGCDNPSLEIAIPVQTAVDAAIIAHYDMNATAPNIKATFADFPHPEMNALLDVVEQYGSTFLYITITFNFVIQMTLVVQEKELHLVDSMRQMGLRDGPYWLSWIIVNTLMNTITVLLMIAFGHICGLRLFQENAFGLVFFLLWLTTLCFTGIAFFFSAFTRSTSTARLIGIGMFVLTFIAAPLLVSVYYTDPNSSPELLAILSRLPFMSFYAVLTELISNTSGGNVSGLTWEQRFENYVPVPLGGGGTTYSIHDNFLALLEGFLVFSVLAWYFDKVMPNEHGKMAPFWFPLNVILPNRFHTYDCLSLRRTNNANSVSPATAESEDAEVNNEAKMIASGEFGDRDPALVIKHLRKEFGRFTAVNDISYAVDKDSLFVLLGHNGAGKTTTLSMLTGLANITSGDATVFGISVKNDMEKICPMMGVCPQHDVLWDKLTGREHLEMFATIKGIPPEEVKQEVENRLADVLLTDDGDAPSGSYSGGMKRRLSIAIALLGDPKIVYLDEPTTGMDPVTRRSVWDMIERAKKGRVIILTTHSMEEADILGDRIGVMSRGKIQALGSGLRLKSVYGSGYRMTMFVDSDEHKAHVMKFVDEHAPTGTVLASDIDGALLYQLPRQDDSLALVPFFAKFEENAKQMGVSDFSIGLTTLEEVFLNLSNKDHFIEEGEKSPATGGTTAVEPEDSSDKAASTGRKSGFWQQFKALAGKSYAYQKSQKLSCCFIITYPVLMMMILILLDVALFRPLKLEFLCGKGIEASECKENGIDLECYRQGFEFTFASPPEVKVGVIKNGGRTGGINPNCDSRGCFENLERPLFRDIPVYVEPEYASVLGSVDAAGNNTVADRLVEFEANLYYFLLNTSCTDVFDDYKKKSEFTDLVCDDLGLVDNPKAKETPCSDYFQDYLTALDFLEKNGTAEGQCLNAAAATSSTVNMDAVALGEMLLEDRDNCNSEHQTAILSRFDDSALLTDLKSLGTSSGSGILSKFTTAHTWEGPIQDLVFQIAAGVAMATNPASMPRDINAAVDVIVGAPTMVMGYFFPSVAAGEAFQLYLANIDAVRGLSITPVSADREGFLETRIYDQWFGVEYQTPDMEASVPSKDKDLYRQRQYFSHWSAYHMHVVDNSAGAYEYTAYYNNSGSGDTKTGNWHALTWYMDNAIVQQHTGKSIRPKIKNFPRQFTCNRDEWLDDPKNVQLECSVLPGFLRISIIDFVSVILFPYILMIHMFIVASLVVYEKEKRLRMIMKMMGLKSYVYWLVNYFFYLAQYLAMIAIMFFLGSRADLQMFSLHDASVVLLFFFSWGNVMVMFSFLLSIFFSSSRTSTAVIFLMILIMNTTGANLIENLINDVNSTEASYAPFMVFPPLVMIRGVYWLGLAGGLKEAVTMENMGTFGGGAIQRCIEIMWIEWFVCMFLVWYLDKVIVVGFGVRVHPLFFLKPSYWKGVFGLEEKTEKKDLKELPVEKKAIEYGFELEDDAKKEHERVVADNASEKTMVRVARLHKIYDNGHMAVKSLSLGINKNECFGLLGHNGAGKTTTLNMLCGLFEPTSGDARIGDEDHSILTDLTSIHCQMGVCPQHDVIWESLSAKQHLNFYGQMKGLSGKELKKSVQDALRAVNLAQFQNRRAGAFSGGMKRRLSVAISLIGNPTVVYMDEPSTGLDPASRRQLWDVISNAKGNKSIVLTTHSMEEADVLCDRLGIMAAGELQCLGLSTQLKKRFGEGFTLTITTSDKTGGRDAAVLELVKSMFPSAKLLNEPLGGTSAFEINRSEVVLSKVFHAFESRKEEYAITDWGITETTLEEVFLKLAHLSHEKEAKRGNAVKHV